MEKIKYQVFLSSTYKDLSKERKQVLDVLLMADCIPAGMESFVATDDEQFNVIKKVIDLCDYYILIIGKKYGSINDSTGISYTEMEYNYARDKGIPVLVFSIDDSIEVDDEKIESDDIKRGKLAEFKNKAMQNRLASVWRDASDLMGKVAISIMQAKSEIQRPGWRRGDSADNEELLKQILSLKTENEELKEKLSSFSTVENEIDLKGNFYEKEISLHFTERVYVFTSGTVINKTIVKTTLSELFKFVSLRLTGVKTINAFIDEVSAFKSGYYVSNQDALIARNWFEQLNLIESYTDEDDIEKVKLTDFGRSMMNQLNNE
ncbi:DUF4062 domain-containing protein [Carnobacterium sp. PL17GRE32]|uniref:DUF4062 domain-containing protein n=1 Tax=Carnobacterium sp. PL17GRE32 TaxID=2592355 RepID=UPI0011ECB077|nr:DUF4062 domain-containing protein [Carnobacterium sp. PL17GRE32]KAF3304020.1 DUF4062 domain-containing protein [Carnobacterium sp. PL17GRE32]